MGLLTTPRGPRAQFDGSPSSTQQLGPRSGTSSLVGGRGAARAGPELPTMALEAAVGLVTHHATRTQTSTFAALRIHRASAVGGGAMTFVRGVEKPCASGD